MLSLESLSFRYRPEQEPCLDQLSFELGGGELLCVLGANGAGKSTLLKCIIGVQDDYEGHIKLNQRPISKIPPKERARLCAYMPQNYRLSFAFSVWEVVLLGRHPHLSALSLEGNSDRALARSAMAHCEVEHLANRPFDELSGGEQKRVLFAQSLCQDAPCLLLDEPTSSLDPRHAIQVFQLMKDHCHKSNRSVLCVTHDINLALRFADRILLMHQGKSIALAPPEELAQGPQLGEAFDINWHFGEIPQLKVPFVVPAL